MSWHARGETALGSMADECADQGIVLIAVLRALSQARLQLRSRFMAVWCVFGVYLLQHRAFAPQGVHAMLVGRLEASLNLFL